VCRNCYNNAIRGIQLRRTSGTRPLHALLGGLLPQQWIQSGNPRRSHQNNSAHYREPLKYLQACKIFVCAFHFCQANVYGLQKVFQLRSSLFLSIEGEAAQRFALLARLNINFTSGDNIRVLDMLGGRLNSRVQCKRC